MRTRTHTLLTTLITLAALPLLAAACAGKSQPSPTHTSSPAPEITPSPTARPPTPTPFQTRSPLLTAASSTRVALPTVQCQATPQWGLGDLWNAVKAGVGCPSGPQTAFPGQEAAFQGGHAIWRGDLHVIYVLYFSGEPRLEVYRDTYAPGETLTPAPLPTPSQGLGQLLAMPTGPLEKLWREVDGMRQRLGWCVLADPKQTDPVRSFEGIAQDCELGTLVWNRESAFALYFSDMSWEMY